MASELHEERLETVIRHLLDAGAGSVVDLGCGRGELLLRLAREGSIERIVGIDLDTAALSEARRSLGLGPDGGRGRVRALFGSFERDDPRLRGFDAATLVETIEHVDPRRLSLVEQTVFARCAPGTVLITTPNQEYNVVHGLPPGAMRHPDHRFEWTRGKFRGWATGVARRHGYAVRFIDIGPPDPTLGSSTQMARFTRTPATA